MISTREILAALADDGWQEVGQRGSHVQLKYSGKPGVTVPHPRKDARLITVRSIERQSGVVLRRRTCPTIAP